MLPTELLRLIFSHCQIKTLKNARLACRRFSIVAAEELFREVYFTFLPEYLNKLYDIGQSESLGKFVQTIFFYHEPLNESYLDFETWRSAVDNRPSFELFCNSVPDVSTEHWSKWPLSVRQLMKRVHDAMERNALPMKSLKRRHNLFVSLCRNQREIMSDPDTSVELATIFVQFPNLSAVLDYRQHASWNIDGPVYQALHGDGEPPFPIITKMHRYTLLPRPFYSRSGSSYAQWSAHMLCTSLGYAKTNLKELEINIFSKIRTRSIYYESVESACPSYTKGLVHLRTLNLCVTLPVAGTFSRDFKIDFSQLREFLQVSPTLDNLSLKIYYEGLQSIYGGDIAPLLVGLTIPNLRELHLAFCDTRGSELAEFLKRHASTLRSLSLNSLYTFDDITAGFESAWESVIKNFTPHMSLTRCSIEHLREDQELGRWIANENFFLKTYKRQAYWRAISTYILVHETMDYPRFDEPLVLEMETLPRYQNAEEARFDKSTGLWIDENSYSGDEMMSASEVESEDRSSITYHDHTDGDSSGTEESWNTEDSLGTEDSLDTEDVWETEDSSEHSGEDASEID
ncbi:MAG: hypothetical protein Q9167_004166 [Letrouitia subvulpina]